MYLTFNICYINCIIWEYGSDNFIQIVQTYLQISSALFIVGMQRGGICLHSFVMYVEETTLLPDTKK